ncbi:MAG: hypothetical protein H7X86_13070 [Gorillibacterium sp.]|nr:hypothetical protein [Gorillibacterium sp.]
MSQTEKSPFNIEIRLERMGKDYLFLVSGGEAHIGATATAYSVEGKVHTELAVVPGHREDRLALEFAGLACSRLNTTVTVVMGIHLDKASRSDIDLAVQTVREEMDKLLDRLHQSDLSE